MDKRPDWQFVRAWKTEDQRLLDGVNAMWRRHLPFTDEVLLERSRQMVMVAKCGDQVAGVSTAYKGQSKSLNNNLFYFYRYFIDPGYRVAGLNLKLTFESARYLEELAALEVTDKPIGILTVIENQDINKMRAARKAVWRFVPFVFIGNTKEGLPIRVHYFKNAVV